MDGGRPARRRPRRRYAARPGARTAIGRRAPRPQRVRVVVAQHGEPPLVGVGGQPPGRFGLAERPQVEGRGVGRASSVSARSSASTCGSSGRYAGQAAISRRTQSSRSRSRGRPPASVTVSHRGPTTTSTTLLRRWCSQMVSGPVVAGPDAVAKPEDRLPAVPVDERLVEKGGGVRLVAVAETDEHLGHAVSLLRLRPPHLAA